MKIIRPWRELNMVNIYLKIMVSELKLNKPNSQVIPSNGRMTPEALTPVLTFSTCVLFCIYFVPIIWRITKIKTTILTCKSYRNCMYFAPIIWRITKINTTILTCKSCKNFASNLEPRYSLSFKTENVARIFFRFIFYLALLNAVSIIHKMPQ